MTKITEKWDEILKEQFCSDSYLRLREFLKTEYSTQTVYPSMYDIFNSMKYTDFDDVKVVLLGQDPYHNVGQAMGLSFSVPVGVDVPPSLVNIYKEIKYHTNQDEIRIEGEREEKRARRRLRTDFSFPPPLPLRFPHHECSAFYIAHRKVHIT